MQTGIYTGIGLIGNESLSTIYAVNNGIVDINGTGIYHAFYKNYAHDLLQSAVTMLKVGDTIYYGNKVWNKHTHPLHIKPENSYVEEGYRYCDEFFLEECKLRRKDSVYAYGKNRLVFEMELKNEASFEQTICCYGYTAIRNDKEILTKCMENKTLAIHTGAAWIAMETPCVEEVYGVEDSPTDFAYQALLDIAEGKQSRVEIKTFCRVGYAQGGSLCLRPGEKIQIKWSLVFADTYEELIGELHLLKGTDVREEANQYWKNWLEEGKNVQYEETFAENAVTNLIALKAVCVGGYIPADLTGHYFCNKMPCYYARDSIMVARALFLSGHMRESKEIICYLMNRKRKDNGEFFQRYDGYGEPNEGANNNVFHQIDSIGYFCKIVYEFYKETGELLVNEMFLMELIDVIVEAKTKCGMVGPEGGVNEGVFGGAFITSSNMFIYGGIKAAQQMFKAMDNTIYNEKCKLVCDQIYKGIQTTYNEQLGRYDYGYVTYHDHTVRKYDTPQYFGPLYGFPNNNKMKSTHHYFLKYGSFFKHGIGYSEQEYHHGPWLFNTLACAEYCKKAGDVQEYQKKMQWTMEHSNTYGLLPEAVDGNNEENCFINPLSWACAEFVAAYFSEGVFEHEE